MKKKKDILFLCQFFHPEYISSAQLPFDTAKALKNSGFSVGVLCGCPREYSQTENVPGKEEIDGICVHRLKYFQTDRSGFLGRILNYFSFTAMVFLHMMEIARYRAVVVYSNPPILPWITSWAKALFGTKLIFVSYDLYPEVATATHTLRRGNVICRLMEHINKCVYRRADAVVALSGEMRDFILKNREISPEKVHIIPNWYKDEGVTSPDLRENRFREQVGGRFVVSYFGNMGTMQDMQTILGAAELLAEEDIFFLFAGHGNKFAMVQDFFDCRDNGAVYPFLHGKDFQDALAISDCALICLEQGTTGLCVPSKTYSYMMRGLPLVAVMEPCDIVRDIQAGAGVWVSNGDSEGLAYAIRSLQGDPEGRAQMRQVCRALYLEKYTLEICTEKYVKLFRTLL